MNAAKRMRPGPKVGRLAETPLEERPREKMLRKGPEHLDDDELLAIVLGTGTAGRPVIETARELLKEGGLAGLFARGAATSVADEGLGPAKATRIEAVLAIAARGSRTIHFRRKIFSQILLRSAATSWSTLRARRRKSWAASSSTRRTAW